MIGVLQVHIPRTGGTSLQKFLSRCPNFTSIGHNKITSVANPESWFKIAFVRNPWERVISSFHAQIKSLKKKSVPYTGKHLEVLEKRDLSGYLTLVQEGLIIHLANEQVYYISNDNGDLMVDFIGRFELYEEEVRRLLEEIEKLGIMSSIPSMSSLKRYRFHGSYNFKDFYDSETIDKVASMYLNDIKTFNYSY